MRLNTADFWDFATHHGLVLLGEYIYRRLAAACRARYRAAPALNAATM